MTRLLVADIGGTNARFGLIDFDGKRTKADFRANYVAEQQITLRCAEYPNIAEMVKACCAKFDILMPDYACFALAGPIENGYVDMTNLNWQFSIEDVRLALGMKQLHLINDFAALAYAVPFLAEDELITLYDSGKSNPNAPIVVMGPGTGFGMSLLVPDSGDWKIIPTEGGHTSFAPTTEKELKIKSLLLKNQKHVSVENILSGGGLVNLYTSLATLAGVKPENYSPADVGTKGVNNEDALCREAVLAFCDVLGSVAGDKALTTGAKGGVVIGGGVTPKLVSLLGESNFLERYKNKGPLVDYVSDISIRLIINDKAALVGSAAWLINHTPELR